MTASAKYADILLPGVSMFESENITENKNGSVLLMDFSSAKIGDGLS